MTQTIYTDRSRIQAAQRCRRLRWLEYHEGQDGMGLQPVRQSSHLVVGAAVHAGLAYLLAQGQRAVDDLLGQRPDLAVAVVVADLFRSPVVREIEDEAVAAALTEFDKEFAGGVDLDPEEARSRLALAGPPGQPEVVNDLMDQLRGSLAAERAGGGRQAGRSAGAAAGGESPIIVEFGDFSTISPVATMPSPGPQLAQDERGGGSGQGWQPFDQDAWLREELQALTEAMVRCWARRRWQGVHEAFTILEIEREGCWRLAEWGGGIDYDEMGRTENPPTHELYFLSRHDALLLERSTGYLYLQSFKTTGAWDRRKELDAQVDMQGLSEAVDVERRFGEAWELIQSYRKQYEARPSEPDDDAASTIRARIKELVSDRVGTWLYSLPDPPTILGVRYEYLLKGPRKENKKAQPGEPRWNQESVLVRAYAQEGITSADRRWAWTYDWKDEGGRGRRLDYRSWGKQAVWRAMTIREWVDLLDQGKVQEGALGEDGEPLDALGEQLVPVLVAYRNSDEMLDLLEQMEEQEVQVARDVEAVREAERTGGYSAKRSALNRLFPQTRTACSYPGICSYRSMPTAPGFCFGPPDPEHDSTVLEHFKARQPNHPQESSSLVNISLDTAGDRN